MLDEIGFVKPRFTDLTDAYLADLRQAFRRSGDALGGDQPRSAAFRNMLVAEADYWTRRMTLLQSGEIRLFRVATQVFRGGDVI